MPKRISVPLGEGENKIMQKCTLTILFPEITNDPSSSSVLPFSSPYNEQGKVERYGRIYS